MENYSNREIDEMKNDIFLALGRIETQTIKTNGSVAEIKAWKERTKGAMWASGLFISIIVIPILSWSIYTLVNIAGKINSLETTLQSYNIEIHD